MKEVNTVILENGLEYIEIDELIHNDIKYILLANYKNIKDFCIRKVSIENGKEYLCELKDENEFKNILNLFVLKNKVLFD